VVEAGSDTVEGRRIPQRGGGLAGAASLAGPWWSWSGVPGTVVVRRRWAPVYVFLVLAGGKARPVLLFFSFFNFVCRASRQAHDKVLAKPTPTCVTFFSFF
jgi:hypothetical protein